ncbi:MAG TPA: AzlC family ABC transporter permease [Micromonosporaceae bacterium]
MDPGLTRDVGALAVATALVGASFGAIAVAAGLSVWLVVAMSVFVFAGASQFAAVAVIASGGSPLAAVLAGLVLNVRHVPLGLAVGDILAGSRSRRLLGSHLLVDEGVAFALAQSDPRRRRLAYWFTGVSLFVAWNVGVAAGAVAGRGIGDPAGLGLDAAFPAALAALLLPSLRQRQPRRVALIAVLLALATTPVLPPGVPVLLALAALPVVAMPGSARDRSEPAADQRPGRTRPDTGEDSR